MRAAMLPALLLATSSVYAAMILGWGIEGEYFKPTVERPYHRSSELSYTSKADPTTDPAWGVGAYFEHPLPVIPNLRVDYGVLKYSHEITIDQWNGHFTGQATREVTLNQLDVTPYYEILDNWVQLDVGLTLKKITGDSITSNTSQKVSETIESDKLYPMLYGRVGLEAWGIGLEAKAKHIDTSGLLFTDAQAKLSFKIWGIGLFAGYKYEQIDLDEGSNERSKITIEGPVAGLFYHF